MAPFQHKPIDLDGRSFRLFRLFKGECGSLEGELFDAWLQDTEGLIEYEALSYTWGGSYKPQDVTIDGKLMLVTTNLFRALQHLRCRNRDRILWIDAICIDQTNEKERGHQVQQMTDIYRTAERVLIWLGQSTPETDTVFDHMLQLARDATKYACKHWVASDKRWMEIWSSVQPPSGHAHGDLRAEERKGFEIILRRPWFKRVWIIQEVANARSAQIVCGTKSVSAHIFAVTPALLEVKPPPHYQAILDIMPGPTRAWSWWNRKHDLHTLLLKFGGSEASDPRDMVYALLGISSDGGSTDTLVPDYEKSLRRVIHDTLAFLLRLDNGKCSRPPLPPWTLPDLLQDLESLGNATIMWAAKTGQEALWHANAAIIGSRERARGDC
ncbi:heterokaryon incompatibility protein-domain-containing protein [Lophiotrema nucula]|uniref:Heterokaryon incompatibility protein-domain-containing protein n=1 Tax=Lophiotrema nucula TaxID=690887 RepID=A0A6A5ZPV0_9PLEO|nr:heterokaryon incompatibility protein-domain-containing protein [Lophiotrema nucula]